MYVERGRDSNLARLIDTERGRLILIDSLLGALGALLEEGNDTRREPYELSLADPELIIALIRKMLGSVVTRLDRVHVDSLIAQIAPGHPGTTASQRRRARPATTQRRVDRTWARSNSAKRTGRSSKVSRAPSRATRGFRKEDRRSGKARAASDLHLPASRARR